MAENGAYAFRVNQPLPNTKCQCKLPAVVIEPASQAERALSSYQPFADNKGFVFYPLLLYLMFCFYFCCVMFIRLLSYERIARVCVCTTLNAARIFVWEAPKIK